MSDPKCALVGVKKDVTLLRLLGHCGGKVEDRNALTLTELG